MTNTPNGSVQDSCAPTADVYQRRLHADEIHEQSDADAEHKSRRDEAADHQVEDNAVATEAAAEGETGKERHDDGDHGDDHGELDGTVERALDVTGAHLGEQIDEPVQRQALHGKNEATANILERQDVDADHRPVEREDVKDEDGEQDVERPGPPTGARCDGVGRHGLRHLPRSHRAIGWRHCAISLRTSTVRRIAVTISMTTIVNTTALAAADGYCRTPTSS